MRTKLNIFILVMFAAFLAYTTAYEVVDDLLFEQSKLNYSTLKWICRILPDAADSCYRQAEYDYVVEEYELTLETLQGVLRRDPGHYPAIRLMGLSLLELKRTGEACSYLRQFDEMFDKTSTLHQKVKTHCGNSELLASH